MVSGGNFAQKRASSRRTGAFYKAANDKKGATTFNIKVETGKKERLTATLLSYRRLSYGLRRRQGQLPTTGSPNHVRETGRDSAALIVVITLQGSAKRRGLGCVNSLPGSAWL